MKYYYILHVQFYIVMQIIIWNW